MNFFKKIIVVIVIIIAIFLFHERSVTVPVTNKINDIILDPVKETLISLNEKAIAMIKDIYQKDTKYYIVLDYVTVKENEYMNNLDLVNLNKKLRTLELDSNVYIQLIRYKNDALEQKIVNSNEFYKILKDNGKDYYSLNLNQDSQFTDNPYYQSYGSPFSIKVEQGKLVELKQIYQE